MDIDTLIHRNDECIDKYSKYLFVGLFALGVYLLCLTIICPVKASANAVLVYARNIASILTWWSMALFFKSFRKLFNNPAARHMKTMKYFTVLSFIVALMCLVKVVLSALNVIHYLNYGSALIPFYYVGEFFAWLVLAIFFTSYAIKIINKYLKRN